MIRCVLGNNGSGKTLYMLWLMGQYVKAGCLVATNMRLTKACPFYDKVAVLDDAAGQYPVFRPGDDSKRGFRAFWHYLGYGWKIFIDEMHLYFDSKYGQKVADGEMAKYIAQHAKLQHDIIFAAQRLSSIHCRIRACCQSFIWCVANSRADARFKMVPKSLSRFLRVEYCTDSFKEQDIIGRGHFWYREASEMFGWYHREQLLGDSSMYADWMGAESADNGIKGVWS